MTAHDRCCPLDDADGIECAVCDAIARARSEEKHAFDATWRANLPRVSARNWMDGYRAAVNGRTIPEWVTAGSTVLRRG